MRRWSRLPRRGQWPVPTWWLGPLPRGRRRRPIGGGRHRDRRVAPETLAASPPPPSAVELGPGADRPADACGQPVTGRVLVSAGGADESACTPGPVAGAPHGVPRPAAIHLGLPSPAGSSGPPAGSDGPSSNACAGLRSPAAPLDLAPGGVYRAARVTPGAGGLLHHRFTLTPAAETAVAVCFLWHCPAGRPGLVLPTTLPCGARTFLGGVQAPRRGRPAGSSAV